jgi:hypothetical protein
MRPLELIAPLARITRDAPGPWLVDELIGLEALASAIGRACPAAERHFHEDYCGRSILIIDLPPRPGLAASLVVAPAGLDRFDLARMVDDAMQTLASGLGTGAVLARVLAECGPPASLPDKA